MTRINTSPLTIVHIEKLVSGGEGLARTEYGIVLVPGVLKGETVEIDSIHRRKGVLRGIVSRIIKPAPERVSPFCHHFIEGCGGCQWQHIIYNKQIAIKNEILRENLQRIAHIDPLLDDPLYDPEFRHTRIRTHFHRDPQTLQIGFFRAKTHDLTPIHSCPLCVPSINKLLKFFNEQKDYLRGVCSFSVITSDQHAHLHFKTKKKRPELLRQLCNRLDADRDMKSGGSAESNGHTYWHHGTQWICIEVNGIPFKTNSQSFFQGHHRLNHHLVRNVKDMIGNEKREILIDLFCGVGLFGLSVAHQFKKVIGIDSDRQAILFAQENARLNKIHNTEFYLCDLTLDNILTDLDKSADVVILDPPRSGCPKRLREQIIDLSPQKIIVVSCDSATMARDIKRFTDRGYYMISCTSIDLFPQTFHIEAITHLQKSGT